MGMNSIYKTLFEFKILHHYFLDEGDQAFDVPVPPPGHPNNTQRKLTESRLVTNRLQYTLSDYMSIVPSQKTAQKLKNWRGTFSFLKESFKVGLKRDNTLVNLPFIAFPKNDLYFDFIVRISDQLFENYTDINIDRSKIVFISNQTEANSTEDYATPVDFKRISNFNTGGYVTPPTRIDLSNDIDPREYSGAFMIIRIHLEGEGIDLDLINPPVLNNPIEFKTTTPVFEIIFPTRETKWRYIEISTGVPIFTTAHARPLTKNGYIKTSHGGKDYPNPDAKIIKLESTIYYSEIFTKS